MSTKRRTTLTIIFVVFIVDVVTFLNCYKYQNRLVVSPPPSVGISNQSTREDFHKNGYQDVWVQYIENGLVQVQMVDTKTVIIFRPQGGDIKIFEKRKSYITPVTFECEKKIEDDCDLTQPYKLYVNNLYVELVEIIKQPR